MTMADYLDKLNEKDDSSIVQEPVVSMNVRPTKDLLDRRYDPNATIENGNYLHEEYAALSAQIDSNR